MFVLTVFGFISINDIVQSIKKKIEAKGVERITLDIEEKFINEHQETIIRYTTGSLLPRIESKIDIEIQEFLENYKNAERAARNSNEGSISDGLEDTSSQNLYYVIVGSSPKRSDLANERDRIKQILGPSLKKYGLPVVSQRL